MWSNLCPPKYPPPHLLRNRDFDWESQNFLFLPPQNKKSSENPDPQFFLISGSKGLASSCFLDASHGWYARRPPCLWCCLGSPYGFLNSCLWVTPRISQFSCLGLPLGSFFRFLKPSLEISHFSLQKSHDTRFKKFSAQSRPSAFLNFVGQIQGLIS